MSTRECDGGGIVVLTLGIHNTMAYQSVLFLSLFSNFYAQLWMKIDMAEDRICL